MAQRASKLKLPAGAAKAELPQKLAPFLATLVDGPPRNSEHWIFEIKFDGYRMLTRVDQDGRVCSKAKNSCECSSTNWDSVHS